MSSSIGVSQSIPAYFSHLLWFFVYCRAFEPLSEFFTESTFAILNFSCWGVLPELCLCACNTIAMNFCFILLTNDPNLEIWFTVFYCCFICLSKEQLWIFLTDFFSSDNKIARLCGSILDVGNYHETEKFPNICSWVNDLESLSIESILQY